MAVGGMSREGYAMFAAPRFRTRSRGFSFEVKSQVECPFRDRAGVSFTGSGLVPKKQRPQLARALHRMKFSAMKFLLETIVGASGGFHNKRLFHRGGHCVLFAVRYKMTFESKLPQ